MTLILHCTACGMQGEVKCSCAKPYAYISARKAAALGVATHPDWSDVRIAKTVGCSDKTVAAARNPTSENSEVEKPKRIGRDGKKRSGPKKATKVTKSKKSKKPKIDLNDIPPAARNQQFTPQENWEASVIAFATHMVNIDKEWTERFGDWKQFQMTACTYNLIVRAGITWKELVDAASPKLIVNNAKEVS
jgi:hypothetical protein